MVVLGEKPTGRREFQENLCLEAKQNKPPPRTESPKAELPSISDTISSLESPATELRLSGSLWERLLIFSHGGSVWVFCLFVFKTGSYYVALTGLEITMETRLA